MKGTQTDPDTEIRGGVGTPSVEPPKRFSLEEQSDLLRKELIDVQAEIDERNERMKQLRAILKAIDKQAKP